MASAQDAAKIERGRYLTLEVGKCQDCHTPRTETGEFDKEKWMKGAVLDFAPLKEVKGWHKTSPDLTPAGRLWSRWKREGILKYLQTGLNPNNGKPADPPMPGAISSMGSSSGSTRWRLDMKRFSLWLGWGLPVSPKGTSLA